MTNAPTHNGLTGLDHFDDCCGFTLGMQGTIPASPPVASVSLQKGFPRRTPSSRKRKGANLEAMERGRVGEAENNF